MVNYIRKFGNPLFGALALVLVAISSSSLSQTDRRPAPLKPGTEVTTGVRDLPDPLFRFNAFSEPALLESAVIKETNGCKVLKSWEPVFVSSIHLRSIYEAARPILSDAGVLAIASESNCVRVGTPMHLAELDGATGTSSTLGYFLPTAISLPRPTYAALENVILLSAGLLGSKAPVVFVTGAVISLSQSHRPDFFAPRMVGARMLDRTQIESAIADGTQIIDVRSKKQFDLVRVKGAVHVPYTMGPRAQRLDPYASYAKSGDAFDIRRINPDRQKALVLIGENNESEEPIRAAVVLRSEGWKNIFIFQEGMSYFTGMMSAPPNKSVLVGLVSTIGQLRNARADAALGAKLIDVRSLSEFNAGTIAESLSAPFAERDDLRLRRLGLNGSMLTTYGDSWAPPANLPKTTPLIFYGENDRDWRPYKAALIARAAGFNSVYWFPNGFSLWSVMSSYQQTLFPVTVRTAQ